MEPESKPASRPSTFDTTEPKGGFRTWRYCGWPTKPYAKGKSKPLWAVEYCYNRAIELSPLWGVVNDSYETTDGPTV